MVTLFDAPNILKKLGHIALGLSVRQSVHVSVQKKIKLGFLNFINGLLIKK